MKKIVSIIIGTALVLGLLVGNIDIVNTKAAEYGLSNPRTEDGITTWDCVYFGNYWKIEYEPIQEPENPINGTVYTDTDGTEFIYDNDNFNKKVANDKYFKKEPIKWRVLSVDGENAFLLADQNLDCRIYHNLFKGATWENCKMRKWLNDDFYNNAFTDEEKNAILITEVENRDNPPFGTGGVTTSDKVFLLSLDEVTNPAYGFPSNKFSATETRVAKNTEYVASYGYTSPTGESDSWWLRTPRTSLSDITIADSDGIVNKEYFVADPRTVRPALHLNLSSSVWSKADTVSATGGEIADVTPTPTSTPTHSATPQVTNTPVPTKKPISTITSTPQPQSTPTPNTVTAPSKVQKLKVNNNKKKSVTVSWKKVSCAKGYQIQYATDTAFSKKKSKSAKKTKITIKKLKKKKTYSFRVRAYKLNGKKKVYGKWSKPKKVKIKR